MTARRARSRGFRLCAPFIHSTSCLLAWMTRGLSRYCHIDSNEIELLTKKDKLDLDRLDIRLFGHDCYAMWSAASGVK